MSYEESLCLCNTLDEHELCSLYFTKEINFFFFYGCFTLVLTQTLGGED